MDNEETTDQQAEPSQTSGDESVEEFKEQVESDPATAKDPDDDEYQRIRGG